MTIQTVRDALLSVLPDRVYHYYAPGAVVDAHEAYAVWGETGIEGFNADDIFAEWTPTGMIYYYTPDEYDPKFDALCSALDAAGVSVRPGRIGYDDGSAMIAYELTWAVTCEPGALYRREEGE